MVAHWPAWQSGSQVIALTIRFVTLDALRASTFEIAILNVIEVLPFPLAGLVAGVWVDRLRRRPILIAGDLGRAGLLLCRRDGLSWTPMSWITVPPAPSLPRQLDVARRWTAAPDREGASDREAPR